MPVYVFFFISCSQSGDLWKSSNCIWFGLVSLSNLQAPYLPFLVVCLDAAMDDISASRRGKTKVPLKGSASYQYVPCAGLSSSGRLSCICTEWGISLWIFTEPGRWTQWSLYGKEHQRYLYKLDSLTVDEVMPGEARDYSLGGFSIFQF